MDFESILTFILIFAFFILPGILKQLKASKKQGEKGKKPERQKGKKPSLFDKLNDKIQAFVLELEQQAEKQKQEKEKSVSLWEALEEAETSSQQFEPAENGYDYFKEPEISEAIIPEEETQLSYKAIKTADRVMEKPYTMEPVKRREAVISREPVVKRSGVKNLNFRSNPLQNAVIWSEILGKPVGLRG